MKMRWPVTLLVVGAVALSAVAARGQAPSYPCPPATIPRLEIACRGPAGTGGGNPGPPPAGGGASLLPPPAAGGAAPLPQSPPARAPAEGAPAGSEPVPAVIAPSGAEPVPAENAPTGAAPGPADVAPAGTDLPARSGSGPDGAPAAAVSADAPPVAAAMLVAQHPVLGPILTDGAGRTLYVHALDAPGVSTCDGDCATLWPPFQPSGTAITMPNGVDGVLGIVVRLDGVLQLTYNGMPLYYFAGDVDPGDANGAGVDGVWFAATP